MAERQQPLLGDLFTGADALALAARRELAALLAVPGRPPALLPGDLPGATLPGGSRGHGALQQVIEAGLGKEVLAVLGHQRLGEVVPAVAGRDSPIAMASWPARLRALLVGNRATTWKALADRTLDEIGDWTDAGPVTVARIVGRSLEAGLRFLAEDRGTPADPASPPPSETGDAAADIALLLDLERAEGGDGLRRALEGLAGEAHRTPARAAAARLLAHTGRRDHRFLNQLDRLLAVAGDERDRTIFERLVLAPDPTVTLSTIAAALEISVERCRQLRSRAEGRVSGAWASQTEHLRWAADELADRLGAAAPLAAVDEALADARLPPMPDSRSLLLLWLAGPYGGVAHHPQWIATQPAELAAETRRMLHEDGGVRPVEQLAKELDVLGLAPAHVERWLAAQPVRLVDDLVVATTGTPGDVVERALSAVGRSMTVEDLGTWVRPNSRQGGDDALWSLLLRDGRFTQVSADAFELAEWGGERHGQLPGLFADTSGRSWLRVEVDDGLLAGTGGPVPLALLQLLTVRPGAPRTFATRYGPLTLSNEAGQPARGSLRPVALAAGATAGDSLHIGFGAGRGDALVERRPAGATDVPEICSTGGKRP